MKKTAKLLVFSSLLLTGMSSLTACGDSFDGLTINFWHTFGQGVTSGVNEIAEDFAKRVLDHDGVKLRIKLTNKGGYDDILGKIGKSFADASNPTIAVAYPDHIANYFAAEKNPGDYVVNMQDFVDSTDVGFGREDWLDDELDETDFIPEFLAESTEYTRNGFYSVPFLKSTEVMLYNLSLLRKARDAGCFEDIGYTLSNDDEIRETMDQITWDEFMDLCESIVSHKTEIANDMLWPVYYDSDSNLMISRLYQSNVAYSGIDSNKHGYIGFDGRSESASEDRKQAYADVQSLLKDYKEWYDGGLFMTKGVKGEYSSNFFPNDKVMFAIGSSGGSGYSLPKRSDFELGSCKVPYSSGNPKYVSQGPTLTLLNNKKMSSEDNKKAVEYGWKFLKFLTNAENNAYLCAGFSEGYVPVRTSAYETEEWLGYYNASTAYTAVTHTVVEDINGNYFSTPVFTGSSELRDQLGGCFADVMKLGKNPSESSIKGLLDTAIANAISKM